MIFAIDDKLTYNTNIQKCLNYKRTVSSIIIRIVKDRKIKVELLNIVNIYRTNHKSKLYMYIRQSQKQTI